MKKRILAIDDEPKILDVVCSYLEHAGYELVTAETGRAGLDQFNREKFDLVVLDLMLPDITGEEVCRLIRRLSKVPILMLTAKVEEQSLLQGFNIGADDYLTKPFSPRELVVRVSALLKRSATHQAEGCQDAEPLYSSDMVFCFDPAACTVSKLGKPLDLTPTEIKLLSIFIRHPGRLYSRNELASHAFGEEFIGDLRTIDTHIKNLRHKIEADPKHPFYLHTVHGLGYKFGRDGVL